MNRFFQKKLFLRTFAVFFAAALPFFGVRFIFAFVGPTLNPPGGTAAIDVYSNYNVGIGATADITARAIIQNNGSAYALKVRNGSADTTAALYVKSDGAVGVMTSTYAAAITGLNPAALSVQGNLIVNGTINGTFVGTIGGSLTTISAKNVTGEVFGTYAGGGYDYSFPQKLGVSTTTQVGLPQALSVYGDGYFSGNVGIGTTAPVAKLHVVGSTSGAAITTFTGGTTLIVRNDDVSGQDAILALVGGSGVGGGSAGITFGNAANAAKAFIVFNNDNDSFQFLTGGAWRATFDSAGRLGIATNTPAYQLDVGSGDINVQSGVYRQGGTAGTSTTCFAGQTLGAPVVRGGIVTSGTCSTPSVGSASAANVASGTFGANVGNGNYSFPGNLGVSTSSNVSLPQPLSVYGNAYISGSLGVGTSTPGEKLEVAGVTYANKAVEDAAGTGFIWDAVGNRRAGLIKQVGFWPEIRYLSSIGLGFRRVTGLGDTLVAPTASDFPLFLAANGNVGIGTTIPGTLLQIGQGKAVTIDPSNTVIEANTNTNAQDAKIKFTVSNTGTGYYAEFGRDGSVGGGGFVNVSNNGTPGKFEVRSNTAVTAVFSGNGNVGIGTTNPQSQLQVSGSGSYIQFPVISGGPPPAADCDQASEAGRVIVDQLGSINLYVCRGTAGWVGK